MKARKEGGRKRKRRKDRKKKLRNRHLLSTRYDSKPCEALLLSILSLLFVSSSRLLYGPRFISRGESNTFSHITLDIYGTTELLGREHKSSHKNWHGYCSTGIFFQRLVSDP